MFAIHLLRFEMVFLWSSTVLAASWLVAPDGSGDFTSIQAALDAASSGDAVVVEPGTYTEGALYNSTYAGGLLIEKPVTIIGAGPDQVFVDISISDSFGRGAAVTLSPTTHELWLQGITFLHDATGSVSSYSTRGYVAVSTIAAAGGTAHFQNVVFSMGVDTNRALVETGTGQPNLIFEHVTADFDGATPADIGAISSLGSASRISNSILANCNGSTDTSSDPEFDVWYSDIYGYDGAASYGTGNINADPMFSDPSALDWTLQSGSPAVDAGDPETSDLDGTVADMGAFGGASDNFPRDEDGDGYYTGVGLGGDPDCDDTDSNVSPGETEVCDKIDNNCDGEVDEASAVDASTWYPDNDGDGYGIFEDAVVACFAPYKHAGQAGDCDDDNPATAPGSNEYCNEIDDNCNTVVDDNATDALTWYADLDGDGYGDDEVTVVSCEQPSGYVNVGSDCDDSDAELWLSVPDLPASCDQSETKLPEEGGCSALPSHGRAWWLVLLVAVMLPARRR